MTNIYFSEEKRKNLHSIFVFPFVFSWNVIDAQFRLKEIVNKY